MGKKAARPTGALCIRWGIRRDMGEILAAERDAPGEWDELDYLAALRSRSVISFVAEDRRGVVGVMVYELHRNRVELRRMCVGSGARREGVGTALLAKLAYKVMSHRREFIEVRVPDRGEFEPALLFLRAAGFRACSVERGAAPSGADIYLLRWRPTAAQWEPFGGEPVNRIADHLQPE